MGKRKPSTLLLAGLILGALASCSKEPDTRKMEEQNKALVQRIHTEVSKGNLEIFDDVLSPDYIRHRQAMPPEFQELRGTEEFKAFVADFVRAVPDCKDEIEFILADSNMVAYVTTTRGTQTGPMGDLPASDKELALMNIVIQRIEDGKIAETWMSWDNVAMLAQLGFFPPQFPESIPGDTVMEYTRLYSDEQGESHFEARGIRFESVDFAPPAPPLDISAFGLAEECFLLRGKPGWQGDWHPAPFRQLHFYLSGEVEVETSDGKIGRTSAGGVALVEDTSGKGHRSRVVSSSDVLIAAVKLADSTGLSSTDADIKAIREFLESSGEAVNTGDVEAEVNRFTEDGIYMWPDAPSIQGHGALRAWFETRCSKVDVSLKGTSEELEVFGDRALERGSYIANIQPKTSDKVETVRGKYLNILKRQPDGSWKISHRIRNRDHPVGRM